MEIESQPKSPQPSSSEAKDVFASLEAQKIFEAKNKQEIDILLAKINLFTLAGDNESSQRASEQLSAFVLEGQEKVLMSAKTALKDIAEFLDPAVLTGIPEKRITLEPGAFDVICMLLQKESAVRQVVGQNMVKLRYIVVANLVGMDIDLYEDGLILGRFKK
jgi:hypothetical protein